MRPTFPNTDPLRAGLVAAGLLGAGVLAARVLRGRVRADLAGKVVLITGGSRGLGLQLARAFAVRGARLALLARDERELERAAEQLGREQASSVESLPCDLRDRQQVEQAVARTVDRWGRLDVLVNNAGTIRVAPLPNLTLADFRNEMETNLFGALHATFAALPHLRRSRRGRIVNITSIGGRLPVPHLLPYTASKFAFVGLSEALHAELAREGIGVTTVTPGLMRTGSPYRALFAGRRSREFRWFLLASSIPLLTIDSGRAASRIVEACARGEASLVIPGFLRLAILARAAAPGPLTRLTCLITRLLPEPDTAGEASGFVEGREVLPPQRSPSFAALTLRAARRNNELD